MNQYQSPQDELAQLFAHTMQLSQHAHAHERVDDLAAPERMRQTQEIENQQLNEPIHYVSAHYTHTAHVRVGDSRSEPSRSPPPPYHEMAMPNAMADLLRHHCVDPFSLIPAQIDLFISAGDEQRSRLLELWRIAPPSYPLDNRAQPGYWEQADKGKGRYEQYARPRSASIAPKSETSHDSDAEPYIVNGYEADQSLHAVDPVYAAVPAQWQAPCYSAPTLQSCSGYGQLRNHADWEHMNRQMMQERLSGMAEPSGFDNDMAM